MSQSSKILSKEEWTELLKTDIPRFNELVASLHKDTPLDLTGAELQNLDLYMAHLSYCDLSDADLSGSRVALQGLSFARLKNTKLEDIKVEESKEILNQIDLLWNDPLVWNDYRKTVKPAIMVRVNFSHHDFGEADLSKMFFTGADLRNSRLGSATIKGTSFFRANLEGVDFSNGKLDLVDFKETTLRSACFDGSHQDTCNFSGAIANGASFMGALLSRCHFTKADVENTNFKDSRLFFCSFVSSKAMGAKFNKSMIKSTEIESSDLRQTDFRQSVLEQVRFDGLTRYDGALFEGAQFVHPEPPESLKPTEKDASIIEERSFDKTNDIKEIIGISLRLSQVLNYENDVQPQDITQLRIDGFNKKIDIHTKDKFLRFKALDHINVLRMNPTTGLMEKILDPALAAGIIYLCNKLIGPVTR